MAKKNIFRKTATDRLSSPEQLDKLLIVISPKFWLGLICILVLLVASVIWMAVATIPVQVNFKGIVSNPQGLLAIHSKISGSIATMPIQKGQAVSKNDVLFTLTVLDLDQKIQSKQDEIRLIQKDIESTSKGNADNPSLTNLRLKMLDAQSQLDTLEKEKQNWVVTSPINGVLDRLEVNLGDIITPSTVLVIIQQNLAKGEKPQVFSYIPLEYQNRIVPGMDADIDILTFDPNVHNSFHGKVIHVSPFAVSKAEILARFGHLNSMAYFAPENTPLLELQIDPESAENLTSGQFCTIRITMTRKKPLEYLFP